jgi:hypothetical protein
MPRPRRELEHHQQRVERLADFIVALRLGTRVRGAGRVSPLERLTKQGEMTLHLDDLFLGAVRCRTSRVCH